MSSLGGPNIVTNGLVLYLDAGNSKSYPTTGTTWYDRSGNGNNGTLINEPTYNSANGGSIVFDGVDDYVNAGNLGAFYTKGTISYWMKSSAVEDYRNPFSTHYLSINVGIRFEQYTTSTPYGGFSVIIGNNSGTYNPYSYSPGLVLTPNVWYNIVLTWDTTINNVIGYFNSVQKFNSTHSLWPTTLPSISIGSGFNSDRYYKGSISQTLIYNRTLTSQEILQNYNATKSRFGL